MLTPQKIQALVKQINEKHTQPQYGLYPPQKKIVNYITRQVNRIQNENKFNDLDKVQQMTNLLEGFIRYLNDTNKILKLDVEKILTYIYYPEPEQMTLNNKDNLFLGSKGATIRLWHDAYYLNNRVPITNRLIDCKNVLYDTVKTAEYRKDEGDGMPEQMEKKYQEMFSNMQ